MLFSPNVNFYSHIKISSVFGLYTYIFRIFLNMFGYKLQFIILIISNYRLICCYCCRDEFINDDVYKDYEEETSSKEIDSNKIDKKEKKFIELRVFQEIRKEKQEYPFLFQNYLKEITRDFQDYIFSKMSIEEEIENKNISTYCYNLSIVSRLAYFYVCKFVVNKDKDEMVNIVDNFNKKASIKDVSKYCEYVGMMKKLCKEKGVKFLDPVDRDKINEYFYRFIHLYLLCSLLECVVDFNIPINKDFDSDKMIDFINTRYCNKKVNFVIFPSFFYNGVYFKNGRQFVFTYTLNKKQKKNKKKKMKGKKDNNTFYFKNYEVEKLDKILID